MTRPLVALISATPAAIGPAVRAFGEQFGEAKLWNLLDDRLLADADDQGGISDALEARMRRLIDYAVAGGADGILLTCSMYGFIAHRVSARVPVYAPDDAAFDEVLRAGYNSVLIVASLDNSLQDAVARFQEVAARAGVTLTVAGVVADGAYQSALAGDDQALLGQLEAACSPHMAKVDAVLLAQYSLSPVTAALARALRAPVFSGPLSAAQMLKERLAVPG